MASLAIVANAASSVLGVIAVAITIPLTLPYLGEERFGVWMTVASFAVVLSFMDLGVGNGMVNRVAVASASGDPIKLRRTITSGLILLSGIAIVTGVGLALLVLVIPLAHLIKVTSTQAAQEASQAVRVFILLYCASIPLGGVARVFQGLQRAWLSHLVRGCGSIASVVLVYLLAEVQASPPLLLLATYGVQVLVPLVLFGILWRERLVAGPAELSRADLRDLRELANTGGFFLIMQIGTVIGWGSDALIVSSLLGAAEVSKLAIAQRLFQFVSVPLAIVNGPLWSPYAEARAKGDSAFIGITLKRSLLGTVVSSLLASTLVLATAPYALEIWLGANLTVPLGLLAAYAIWMVLESTGNAFAMFLNGMGEIRSQAIMIVVFCFVVLPLKIFFTSRYGVAAVVWATVLSYLLYMSAYLLVFGKRIRREYL